MQTYKLNFSAECPQTGRSISGSITDKFMDIHAADDYAEIEARDLFDKNFKFDFTQIDVGLDPYNEARLAYIKYSVGG